MHPLVRTGIVASCAALAAVAVACRPTPGTPGGDVHPIERHEHDDAAGAGEGAVAPGGIDTALATLTDAASDAGARAPATETDPMSIHRETKDDLLSLFEVKDFADEQKKVVQPDAYLRRVFGVDGPHQANQGNKAIARHTISKEKCLEGLKDVVIQTPEQREKCGAENMVPIWVKGKEAWFCIDVFEFPNKPCELPVVWIPPTSAKKVCELQGKRLCSDIEWNIACRGDPEGGDDWRYAYGDKVDIEICHTNLRHRTSCVPQTAQTTWKTCTTDSEPSGAFPKCRSRFGVFDQHGNVAEVMMRREGDKVFTQLKGSAWFYVELVKEPGEAPPPTTTNKSGAYPDHCNFNPRWHVEPIDRAQHVNYHLGFRCCKSIP
jgi:formylglycine-generating enzyme